MTCPLTFTHTALRALERAASAVPCRDLRPSGAGRSSHAGRVVRVSGPGVAAVKTIKAVKTAKAIRGALM